MLIFLGICFLALTLHLTEVKVNPEARLLSGMYLAGLILVDLSILAMMLAIWMMENGRL